MRFKEGQNDLSCLLALKTRRTKEVKPPHLSGFDHCIAKTKGFVFKLCASVGLHVALQHIFRFSITLKFWNLHDFFEKSKLWFVGPKSKMSKITVNYCVLASILRPLEFFGHVLLQTCTFWKSSNNCRFLTKIKKMEKHDVMKKPLFKKI